MPFIFHYDVRMLPVGRDVCSSSPHFNPPQSYTHSTPNPNNNKKGLGTPKIGADGLLCNPHVTNKK